MITMTIADKIRLLSHITVQQPNPEYDRGRIAGIITALYWTGLIGWDEYNDLLYRHAMERSPEHIRQRLDELIPVKP